MVNPYETPAHGGHDSDDRVGIGRSYIPLLLMWGVMPICLSLRQLWHAVENVHAVGHFYPGLIWDGILEYVLLATWLLAVSTRSTEWPIGVLPKK